MEEVENKERVIELHPLGKGKRILAFLADFFIAFIFSFILFNLATFPLAKLAFNTEGKAKEITNSERAANDVLINSKLLFPDVEKTNDFVEYVNYTFKVFLSYYAFDEVDIDKNNPQFGHKEENEVIRHYMVEMKNDETGYLEAFKKENTDNYFEIGESIYDISLKAEYKNAFANELLEVKEDDKYSTSMVNVRDHLFARLYYLNVYNDIVKNDLVVEGVSFNECMKRVSSLNNELAWIASGTSMFTVFISVTIFYLVIPLIQKERKTIGLMMMRIYRVNQKSFAFQSRVETLLQWLYQFIYNLSYGLFLPVLFFGVAYCFALPVLAQFFILSSSIMIVSFVAIMFSQYNRSISDVLTQSVLIPSEEMDNLYKVD